MLSATCASRPVGTKVTTVTAGVVVVGAGVVGATVGVTAGVTVGVVVVTAGVVGAGVTAGVVVVTAGVVEGAATTGVFAVLAADAINSRVCACVEDPRLAPIVFAAFKRCCCAFKNCWCAIAAAIELASWRWPRIGSNASALADTATVLATIAATTVFVNVFVI